jgi:Domain of unknown function (DUF4249)
MKNNTHVFALALISAFALSLFSCETVINADLDTGPAQLSVDGTITDQPGRQIIRLTQTAAYFNSAKPPVASGATVSVTDNSGKAYAFTDPDNDGYYTWQPPTAKDTLGKAGRTYKLAVKWNGDDYTATSVLNQVTTVDSIIFKEEKLSPFSTKKGYQAEFYARDIAGQADYTRIRFHKNDTLQNGAGDIILAYNGAFRGSADTDGLMFIRPIRQSINPDSLYKLNDKVRVDIQSVTAEYFDFLGQVRTQIQNGGLFAEPPANVPTNIINTNAKGRKATGFFVASAIKNRTVRVVKETIRTP